MYPDTGAAHKRPVWILKNDDKTNSAFFFFPKKQSEKLFCKNKYVYKTGFSNK